MTLELCVRSPPSSHHRRYLFAETVLNTAEKTSTIYVALTNIPTFEELFGLPDYVLLRNVI